MGKDSLAREWIHSPGVSLISSKVEKFDIGRGRTKDDSLRFQIVLFHHRNTRPVLSRWLDTSLLHSGLDKLAAEVVVGLLVGSSKAIEWQQKYKDSATPPKNLIRHNDVRYVGPNRSSVGQSEVVGGSSTDCGGKGREFLPLSCK